MTPTEIEERLYDAVAVLRELPDDDLRYIARQKLRSSYPPFERSRKDMDYAVDKRVHMQISSGDVDKANEVLDWVDSLPRYYQRIVITYAVTKNWSKTARVFDMSRHRVRRQFVWALCEISTRLQNLQKSCST